jgi:hypothetical protein
VILLYSVHEHGRRSPAAVKAVVGAIIVSVVVLLVIGYRRYFVSGESFFIANLGWYTRTGRFLNLTRESHMPGLRPVRNVGFSGDGSEIWFGGAPVGRMRIMPMMGGPPRPFLVDRAVEVVWSPDGARMVYHTDAPGDPMFVADRTGAGAKQIFIDPIVGGHCHHQTWSPDGRWIYFARGLQDTRQMDLWRIAAGGGQPERLTYHNAYVGFPTLIDNRSVLYIAQDHDGSGPWLWALDTNSRATRRVAYGTEQYLSIAGSADHRRLVASVANRVQTVDRADSGSPCGGRDAKLIALPTVRACATGAVAALLVLAGHRRWPLAF